MALPLGQLQEIHALGGLTAHKQITFTGADGAGSIAVKASGTLTSDATAPVNNDTVTIDTHVYTFKDTLTGAADEVLVGVSAAVALDNLKSAVNATAGAGTAYGTGTVAHTTVDATTNTDTTQLFVAKSTGTAGNAIVTTEVSIHLSFGAATLTGGANGILSLFSVTGQVLATVIAVCKTSLAGASATHAVGRSGSTARYQAQVTATNIVAGDTIDLSGEVSAGTAVARTPNQSALDGEAIIGTIATANVTAGVIDYYCFFIPLSDSATVQAA